MVAIGNSWDGLLEPLFRSQVYAGVREFLKEEYKTHTVHPPAGDIFNALKFTPYEQVKVVILGQDPYHEPGQAHGLSFSVQPGVPAPPSLKNIFKEQRTDLGISQPAGAGCLEAWARQGVLLLNATLTVRAHEANSHKNCGWAAVTDEIIRVLDRRETPMVFLLWGANAKAKGALVKNPNHLVLTSAHPSPLSAYNGFFGCRHFSKANAFLEENGLAPINWQL